MIKDKTGKELKVGQFIDIPLQGISVVEGMIVDVKSLPIQVPGRGPIPAHIVVQMVMTLPAGPNGGIWCYVTKEPNEGKEGKSGGEVDKAIVQFPVQ